MTYFVGNKGKLMIRRGGTVQTPFTVSPDDVSLFLNRVGLEGISNNYLTGDFVTIGTANPNGLTFFDPTTWDSGTVENELSGFININALDGVRFYPDFESAVNNSRALEYKLQNFFNPVDVTMNSKDAAFNVLGDILSYELNTDRGAIDVSSLSDKFRMQYDAGLISGSGKIDSLFNYKISGAKEPSTLLLQLIQRVDIGSSIECAFYLIDKDRYTDQQSVYYELTAVLTTSGVAVAADDLIRVSADFVTTGEISLKVGTPEAFLLTEDLNQIRLEQSIGSLLQDQPD